VLNPLKREFIFSQQDFEQLRKLLYQATGIKLSDNKDSMVYSRLARRLRLLKIENFVNYLSYLDSAPEEVEHFVNALTTNLTSFFREPHHFDILHDYVLNTSMSKPVTIWCAACSSGEEAYSIAMTVIEAFGRYDPPVKIIASDIDSHVLDVAKKGVYPLKKLENLSNSRKNQFFFKGKGNQAGKVKVIPQLQALIKFKSINLLAESWDVPDNLPVIFCRNVMIYFDKSTQAKLLQNMIGKLQSNGLYFAGHSENFSLMTDALKPLGKTVYQLNSYGSL
jgi:chemotaxis protein methyltransferase CheR